MHVTTSTRAAFIVAAGRIADDIDTALKLPEGAVRRGLANSTDTGLFVYEMPEDNPLRHVDRTDWPEAAAWLRNIGEFIDALPGVLPECVFVALSKLIVSDASVITWWTDDALNRENPFTDRIGDRFIYALDLLLDGEDPSSALDDIALTAHKRQQYLGNV